jgi:hypothetical protein
MIRGEEDLARFYSSAAVAVRSFIFNTVSTARRLNIMKVLAEADLFGDWVKKASPCIQTPEIGFARHYCNGFNDFTSVGCWFKLAKVSDIRAVDVANVWRPDSNIGWKRICQTKCCPRKNGSNILLSAFFFSFLLQ